MNKGFLYVATGPDLVREAEESLQSLRDHMDEIPVAIVTADCCEPSGFDEVIYLESPDYGFKDKIYGMIETPFEKTIYLDTDIYICSKIYELFECLDQFDIAAVHNQHRDVYTGIDLGVPEAFPEYNTGVVVYKRLESDKFLEEWLNHYEESHKGDQPSFRLTLYEGDIRVATLPIEYNYLPRYPGHLVKSIKILHGRILDINTLGAKKTVELPELAEQMDVENKHRLYTYGGRQIGPNNSILDKIKSNTVTYSLKKIINKK